MAKFQTTKVSVGFIETLITEAIKEIILISPFIDIEENYQERLVKRAEENVNIIIVCRADELNNNKLNSLKKIKNITIRSLKELHAKCYCNGEDMLLTSMNLYPYSRNNNYEMGISINKDEDDKVFQSALKEINHIIGVSELVYQNKPAIKTIKPSNENLDGNCIRCKTAIEFDFDKPFCKSCYTSWSKFENEDYPEKYCMSCGKSNETSFAKPICYPCYKASK